MPYTYTVLYVNYVSRKLEEKKKKKKKQRKAKKKKDTSGGVNTSVNSSGCRHTGETRVDVYPCPSLSSLRTRKDFPERSR